MTLDIIRRMRFRRPNGCGDACERTLTSVRRSTAAAIAEIDAELTGLSSRIEDLRYWAGGLIGSEDGSSGWRCEKAESDLLAAERQLLSDGQRRERLQGLRGTFAAVQNRLDDATSLIR